MKKQIHQSEENATKQSEKETEDLKKQIEEKKEIRGYAAEHILGRLLPVIDTFKRAQDHLKDAGLDLAFKELSAALEEQGVERIPTVGKPFNPHEMECIEVVEGEDNTVTEEVLPGYVLRGKLLRAAQVKVGQKSKSN